MISVLSNSSLPSLLPGKGFQKQFVCFLILCFSATPFTCLAQKGTLDVGIRVQKAINLYYENGFTLQYTNDALANERLYFGLSYISSRLGTAINSNAIEQDNFLLSTSFFSRPARFVRPLYRLNIGYFSADLGEAIFDDLPDSSLLLSPELGLCLDPEFPLKFTASLGYNLITGDGLDGPGTLYPVFFQTSLSWDVFHKNKTAR